eukprot:766857-Rhodomonas_salina.1
MDAADRASGGQLRTYDQQGANCDAVFMLALLGEKRGRMLDARDIRRLGVAEQMRKGAFQWAVDAANKGVSATELEVASARSRSSVKSGTDR